MTVKQLTKHHLEFLSSNGCTGLPESTLGKNAILLEITCQSSIMVSFFTGAISLCASNVSNTDIVYKATVTDAEGNPITIGMPSCLPASCPFGFTNGNEQRVN